MKIYKMPLYYEVAFGFVDVKKQLALFEEFIERKSKIEVKRFLDIGCGPSRQLRELAKRGHEAVALDSCREMLKYLKDKAAASGVSIETVRANFLRFKLKKKVDFAFMLMGTIGYVRSNDEFLAHLNSVAKSLRPGGLYLLENVRHDWPSKDNRQSWVMKKHGITVKTSYDLKVKDKMAQLCKETLRLDIDDHGKKLAVESRFDSKLIFPEEFSGLIKSNGKFEFLGWFEHKKFKKLKEPAMLNYALLRRK